MREEIERARRSNWPPPSSVLPSRCTGYISGDIIGGITASSLTSAFLKKRDWTLSFDSEKDGPNSNGKEWKEK